jgi:hypothetical protein
MEPKNIQNNAKLMQKKRWNIAFNAKKSGLIDRKDAALLKKTNILVIEYNLPKFNMCGLLIIYDEKFINWKPNNRRRNNVDGKGAL